VVARAGCGVKAGSIGAVGQDRSGSSPHSPIPPQPEVARKAGRGKSTRACRSPGRARHAQGDGMVARPRMGGVGSARVMGSTDTAAVWLMLGASSRTELQCSS